MAVAKRRLRQEETRIAVITPTDDLPVALLDEHAREEVREPGRAVEAEDARARGRVDLALGALDGARDGRVARVRVKVDERRPLVVVDEETNRSNGEGDGAVK